MNEIASAEIQMTPIPSPGPREQLAGERRLLERYARDRSPTVREELVERFMPLARRLASRYAGGAEPFDDLEMAGLTTVGTVARYVEQRLAPPTQAAASAIKRSPAKGKKKK
jgi:RNA polymerase sigma-B factor